MKKLLSMLVLLGAALDAGAWGGDGHRIVGAMADQLIENSNAQRHVAALLAPGESLETISMWADCAKGDYCGPKTPDMRAYIRANPQHGEYHYADIPFQNPRYRDGAIGSARNDIVQTLKQAIAVLQGKGDSVSNPHHFTPRQALMLIVHLTADIHQPLHVGVGYVEKSGVGKDGAFVIPQDKRQIDGIQIFNTRGGNDLLIEDGGADGGKAKNGPRSFHVYWDIKTVDYAMRAVAAGTPQQFASAVFAETPKIAANTGDPVSWPYQWADDALRASKLAHAGLAPGKMSEQTNRKGERREVWALALPP
ncbi:MAG: S1/P1 nuclease, partial [Burkholderiaceae bacterium]|nr:S1/P1 nuclease [Burkholderiaceae bacterium]